MRSVAEVVVVGGGIIGCCIAAELAEAGADVVLIERREIAHGASGRNHGLMFYPQNSTTDPLYRASREMYKSMNSASTLNLALDDDPRGFIIIVANENEWPAAEAEAMACRAGGVAVKKLDAVQLAEAAPNLARGLLGGWFIDDGFRLDPAALTLAFALKARAHGAELATHTEVKQILTKAGRIVGVGTDAGLIEAPVVVDAAGPWASKLARSAGVSLAITGARGWLMLTEAIVPLCNHLIESSGWHLTAGDPGPRQSTLQDHAADTFPEPDVGLLVQQNATGHVLLGGSRLATVREDAQGDEVVRQIAASGVAAFPKLAGVPVAAIWSGVRPMSRDGLPIIGWVPGVEGLFVAGGHGGQGIILGGGSGKLAAQIIQGVRPFCDPASFEPGRFDS